MAENGKLGLSIMHKYQRERQGANKQVQILTYVQSKPNSTKTTEYIPNNTGQKNDIVSLSKDHFINNFSAEVLILNQKL